MTDTTTYQNNALQIISGELGSTEASKYIPLLIPGMKFWFRSDFGVINNSNGPAGNNDMVKEWTDMSGNGHHLLQGTDSNKPLLIINSVNGKPVLRFDGSDDYMKTVSFTLNQPLHYFIVFKNITQTNSDYLWDGMSGNDRVAAFQSEDKIYLTAGSSGLSLNYGISDFHICSAYYNGSNSKHSIDNGTPSTGGLGSQNPGGLTLGTYKNADSLYGNFDIAEWIGYGNEITGISLVYLLKYLSSRYNITIS